MWYGDGESEPAPGDWRAGVMLASGSAPAQARVLISSGFTVTGEAQSLLDQGACGFLQKPFRANGLATLVAATLKP